MKLLPALAGLALLIVSNTHAADPNLGRNLAAGCASCHGTNGHAMTGAGIETLTGLPQNITRQKLADFKRGDKLATIMPQIVKGYTDEQLDLIAAYFAAQR